MTEILIKKNDRSFQEICEKVLVENPGSDILNIDNAGNEAYVFRLSRTKEASQVKSLL